MSHVGMARRRFVQALAAMLLVTCSLPPSAAVPQDVAAASSTGRVSQTGDKARDIEEEAVEAEALQKVASEAEMLVESPEELLEVGTALLQAGKSGEAVLVLEEAVAKWEQKLGKRRGRESMAVTVHRLGMALGAEGNDERAGEVFARAVRLCEKAFGKGSSQVAESMHGLGVSLFRRGEPTAAASALTKCLRYRPLKPHTGVADRVSRNILDLVQALAQVARISASPGHGDEGSNNSNVNVHLDSNDTRDQNNKKHDKLKSGLAAVDEINLVSWRYFVAQWPWEGQMVLQKALDSVQEEPPSDSPTNVLAISAYLFNLGFLRLAVLGQYSSAAEVLKQAHSLREPMLGATHTLTVQAVVSRGWALTLMGETEQAVEELTRNAQALMAAGQAPEAERLLRQAIELANDPLGPTTYAHACFSQHINLLKSSGAETHDEIERFMHKQVAISKTAALSPRHTGVAVARNLLAEALMVQVQETPGSSGAGSLLELSAADKAQLKEEATSLL